MRQTGFMAGSAAYALTHNFPRLAEVHALARKLEAGLAEIGVRISSPAETCMVRPLAHIRQLSVNDRRGADFL